MCRLLEVHTLYVKSGNETVKEDNSKKFKRKNTLPYPVLSGPTKNYHI